MIGQDLNFIVHYKEVAYSLSPLDCDDLNNINILEQTVGTLVKYNSYGRFEPFIAKSWNVSHEGLVWSFTFRENLIDQIGDPINPNTYKKGLILVLKMLLEHNKKVILFNELKGWDSYLISKNSQDLSIKIDENKIIFEFEKRPAAVLPFLSMLYYGHYNSKNFTSDGKWKDPHHIISSSAYTIESFSREKVVLDKREWFSHIKSSPQKVIITNISNKKKQKKTIMTRSEDDQSELTENFKSQRGMPTLFYGLVLSPFKKNFFNDSINRKVFGSRLKHYQQNHKLPFYPHEFSKDFYPQVPNTKNVEKMTHFNIPQNMRPIKIFIPDAQNKTRQNYLTQLLKTLLPEFSNKLEFIYKTRSDDHRTNYIINNDYYDIRFTGVSTGYYPENWVIDMMFCTKMGVSFPDIDNEICTFTSKYFGKDEVDQSYIDEFYHLQAKQQSVFPLWHTGLNWAYSDDIKPSNITSSTYYPRFDLFELE